MKINAVMGQMLVEGGMKDANLERACSMIREASESGSDIIILPECLDIGWTCPDAQFLAEEIPGNTSDRLSTAAADGSIYVVAGLTEKAGDKIFNTALLISPGGEILSKSRKINILDIAQDIYSTGNILTVTETGLGIIGINICADNFPDTFAIGHTLARMGADIILSPCSWAIPPDYNGDPNPCRMWEKSYTRLAYLFDIPVIGVSNIGVINAGVWKNYRCIGNSLAISRDGDIIKKGDLTSDVEKLFFAEVETNTNRKRGTDIQKVLEDKGFLFDNSDQ
jgi:predicted amidohydrolase